MNRERAAAGAPLDKTDPGSPPESPLAEDAPPPTTEAEMLRAEQLIEAFKRPPRRPTPAYAERAQSEGGNAVGYQATAHVAPGRHTPEEREKVLVQLAAAARTFPADSSDARDVITVPIPREPGMGAWDAKRRRQRLRHLAGGLLVLAVAAAILIPVARLGASDLVHPKRPSPAGARTAAGVPMAGAAETPSAGVAAPLVPAAPAPTNPLPVNPAVIPRAVVSSPPRVVSTSPAPPLAPPPAVPRRSAEPASARVEPFRDRHSESAPASSPAPGTGVPAKDQFWE